MASIFSLFGTIFIDNAEADKSIDTTTEKAEKSGSKVGSAFSSIAKGAAAMGTAVVAGAAAIGTAAYKMASDTAAAADNVDKMSQKIGISRESYQEWDYIMSQCGMDVDKLQTGVKTLTAKMSDAAEGNKTAAAAFDKLGISVTNTDGSLKSQEQMFNETIAALQGMENETERAALATELFGKAGVEMAPLLNSGAESIEELRQKAHDLGMVMSDETIDAGVVFTDSIDTIKRSLKGLMNNLGGAVMPIVQSVLDLIINNLPLIQGLFSRLSPILQEVFENILPPLFDLVETLLPILLNLIETLLPPIESIITAILPVIVSLIQQLLPFVIQIVEQVLPILVDLINGIMPLVLQIIDTVLPILIQLIQAILPPIIQIIQAILPVVIQLLQMLLPPILQIVNTILPVIINLINLIMPLVVRIIEAILPIIIQLIEMLLPPILQIIDQVLPILLKLIETIVPIAIQIIEAILPVVISLLDALLPVIKPILDILMILLEPLLDLLNLILPPLCDFIKMLFDKLLPPLSKAFSGVADIVGGVFKNAFDGIKKVFENVKGIFNGIIDFVKNVFTGNWRGAWDSVVSIFKNIFEGIKNAFKVPINWIIDGINVFIRGLNKLKIPDWVPGVGGLGLNIKELSRLRIGMEYVPYDEYPALLHKGERVLTAGENKEYSAAMSAAAAGDDKEGRLVIKIELGEKAIYIENLKGDSEQDVESFVDLLLELIAEKIQRKGVVFA